MKKVSLFLVSFLMFSLITSVSVAQQRNGEGPCNQGECMIPDLTEEQQSKIQVFKADFMQEAFTIKNQIRLKKAELNILQTAEKVDMNKVNTKIKEIGDLTTQIHLKKAEMHNNVRNILNDEQKLAFDLHHSSEKGPHGHGHMDKKGPHGNGHMNKKGHRTHGDCKKKNKKTDK